MYQTGMNLHMSAQEFPLFPHDACLYILECALGPLILAVCRDEFLVISPEPDAFYSFFSMLHSTYPVKRIGDPAKFLGWTVRRLQNGALQISQPTLILAILQRNALQNDISQSAQLPRHKNFDESLKSTSLNEEHKPTYQQAAGELHYLAD